MSLEKIKFEGFEPTYRLKNLAKDVLKRVEDHSPSQACHQAIISKTEEGFLGKLKVASLAGVFSAESHSHSPSHVLDDLYKKIRLELNEWLHHREVTGE